jgi:nucleoside-diphosphate-sugar epimerase
MSSAGALYDSNQIVNEKSKLNICTDYAELKFEFENLLIKSARQSGFIYQILRVSNLYGSTINKEIRGGFINELINSALKKSSFTLANNFREINKNFLFIDDLLLIFEFLLNEKVPQNYIVNIANDNSLNLDKVLEITLKVLADYKLEPEINLKNLNYNGNSNHEFDLKFLQELIPEHRNTPLEQGLIKTLRSII